MDNDIIERAKEYADRRLKGTEISDFGVATVYSYKDVYNANIAAYERGAKEQKAVDIEKAYEWLKENVRNYAHATVRCYKEADVCDVHQEMVEDFRKAMEE